MSTTTVRTLRVRGIDRTTAAFRLRLHDVASRIGCNPDHLAALISFESAGSFSPAQPNLGGSGAVGLIQFMPATAKRLGTTTAALAAMSAEEQLGYVERYFLTSGAPKQKFSTLEGLYTVVLAGRTCGPSDPVFRATAPKPESTYYAANRYLDANKDGVILGAEAAAPIRAIMQAAKGVYLSDSATDWTGGAVALALVAGAAFLRRFWS